VDWQDGLIGSGGLLRISSLQPFAVPVLWVRFGINK